MASTKGKVILVRSFGKNLVAGFVWQGLESAKRKYHYPTIDQIQREIQRKGGAISKQRILQILKQELPGTHLTIIRATKYIQRWNSAARPGKYAIVPKNLAEKIELQKPLRRVR